MLNINLSQRTMLGIGVLLALLAVYTLFYSLWQWQHDWRLAHDEPPTGSELSNRNQTDALIAALPNTHLFGKNLSKTSDMPITNLQLNITGIVKTDNAHSKVYISISGQPGKIYQMGDSLPYGVKIADISTNAVILENDGHLEKLPLAREPLIFKPLPEEESH